MQVLYQNQPTLTQKTVNAVVEVKWPDISLERISKRIIICLDTSGSMDFGGKLKTAKSAIESVVAAIPDYYEVGVVTFSTTATVVHPLTLKKEINLSQVHADSSTNLGEGFQRVAAMIQGASTVMETTVLVLTDGQINAGLVRTVEGLGALVQSLSTVQFRILGIGQDYDEQFLQALTQAVPNGIFQHCTDTHIAENVGEVVGLCLETVGTNIHVGVQLNGLDGTLQTLGDPLGLPNPTPNVLEFRQPIAPGGGTTYFTFAVEVGAEPSSLTVKVVYTQPSGKVIDQETTFQMPPMGTETDAKQINSTVLENVLRLQVLAAIQDLTTRRPGEKETQTILAQVIHMLRNSLAAETSGVQKLIQMCETLLKEATAERPSTLYKMCSTASSAARHQSNGIYATKECRKMAETFQKAATQ